MRIGVTYDLRDDYRAQGLSEEETAEFDVEETISAVCGALGELGHAVERIGGIRPLTGALAEGRRWDGVFNICEGLKGVAREAQVPALLEAFDIH
jgi:D-alanine-D-alanine ligase